MCAVPPSTRNTRHTRLRCSFRELAKDSSNDHECTARSCRHPKKPAEETPDSIIRVWIVKRYSECGNLTSRSFEKSFERLRRVHPAIPHDPVSRQNSIHAQNDKAHEN